MVLIKIWKKRKLWRGRWNEIPSQSSISLTSALFVFVWNGFPTLLRLFQRSLHTMFPKTIFSFLYRFCLEIETYYTGDGGDQENVFKLSDSEMRNRVVDLIDVVKDQVTFSRCFLLRHHNFSSFATFFPGWHCLWRCWQRGSDSFRIGKNR